MTTRLVYYLFTTTSNTSPLQNPLASPRLQSIVKFEPSAEQDSTLVENQL